MTSTPCRGGTLGRPLVVRQWKVALLSVPNIMESQSSGPRDTSCNGSEAWSVIYRTFDSNLFVGKHYRAGQVSRAPTDRLSGHPLIADG